MTGIEKLRVAILHAQNARRDFDKRAVALGNPELNNTLAAFRHALRELDLAAAEFESEQ